MAFNIGESQLSYSLDRENIFYQNQKKLNISSVKKNNLFYKNILIQNKQDLWYKHICHKILQNSEIKKKINDILNNIDLSAFTTNLCNCKYNYQDYYNHSIN